MSRAFSNAAQQLKKLTWTLNGTTADVGWAQRYTEKGVDMAHGLGDRVDSGTVQGNPHPTPKNDDPLHASITLKKGDVRVVSAHVYPDGSIDFSKDFESVKVNRDPHAPEGPGSPGPSK